MLWSSSSFSPHPQSHSPVARPQLPEPSSWPLGILWPLQRGHQGHRAGAISSRSSVLQRKDGLEALLQRHILHFTSGNWAICELTVLIVDGPNIQLGKHHKRSDLSGQYKWSHVCSFSVFGVIGVPWIPRSQHQSWVSGSHTPVKRHNWTSAGQQKYSNSFFSKGQHSNSESRWIKTARLTVMKMGSSNKSEGVSKKFRKNVWAKDIKVWLVRAPASSETPSINLWLEVHLIKDGVVAFSDAGSLSLTSNC